MDYTVKGVVKGHVQGVGFREFVKQLADQYQLRGYVKNLSDGTVEVLLQGDSDQVNEVQHRVSKGPSASDVRSLSWKLLNDVLYEQFTVDFT